MKNVHNKSSLYGVGPAGCIRVMSFKKRISTVPHTHQYEPQLFKPFSSHLAPSDSEAVVWRAVSMPSGQITGADAHAIPLKY